MKKISEMAEGCLEGRTGREERGKEVGGGKCGIRCGIVNAIVN